MASNELKKIRGIRNKILSLEVAEMDITLRRDMPAEKKNAELAYLAADKAYQLDLLETYESRYLIRKAENWGIEVPYKPEWYVVRVEDPKNPHELVDIKRHHLNSLGRAVINRQIREARFAKWEGLVKILTPILALIVAALSLFKDIITEVLKNKF